MRKTDRSDSEEVRSGRAPEAGDVLISGSALRLPSEADPSEKTYSPQNTQNALISGTESGRVGPECKENMGDIHRHPLCYQPLIIMGTPRQPRDARSRRDPSLTAPLTKKITNLTHRRKNQPRHTARSHTPSRCACRAWKRPRRPARAARRGPAWAEGW